MMESATSEARFTRTGAESLTAIPKDGQAKVLRRAKTIESAPDTLGTPLRRELKGYRSVHVSRYRIIWRVNVLPNGSRIPEIVYVGIRKEGDEADAYNRVAQALGIEP